MVRNAAPPALPVPRDTTEGVASNSESDESDESDESEEGGVLHAFSSAISSQVDLLKEHVSNTNPFEEWNRFELTHALVSNEVELRNQAKLSDNMLRRMLQELYEGYDLPEKPRKMDLQTFKVVSTCAHRVQRWWRNKVMIRKWRVVIDGARKQVRAMREKEPVHIAVTPIMNRALSAEERDKWVPPDEDVALHYAELNMVREGGPGGAPYDFYNTNTGRHCNMSGFGEQCDLWNEGKWSDLSPYGPGLTNFFKFLKWGYWLLFAVFVVMMPSMLISLQGTALPQDVTTMDAVSRTMAGNLGDTYNATVLGVKIPGCENGMYNIDCYIDKADASVWYGQLNVLAMCIVLIGIWWLKVFERKEERLDDYSLFASAYTIEVWGLPLTATEDTVKAHFEKVTDAKVAEVFFAFDNEADIYEYKARGLVQEQKDRSKVEAKYVSAMAAKKGGEISDSLKARLQHAQQERQRELQKIDDRLKQTKDEAARRNNVTMVEGMVHGRPVRAYVTFQDIKSRLLAENLYPNTIFSNLCGSEDLLYQGKLLGVRQAPEPSTIIWENLHYSWLSRAMRGMVSNVLMVVLIIATIFVAFVARVVQQSTEEAGGIDECPVGFNKLSSDAQLAQALHNEEVLHCYCDLGGLEDEENCGYYHDVQSYADFIVIFASGVVTMLNMFLEAIIDKFADYEKPSSLEDRDKSIFGRLFLYKYINMGLIFLMNEDRFGVADAVHMQYDAKADFTVKWYQSAGVMLLMLQVTDVFVSHGMKMFVYWQSLFYQWYARKNPMYALTQAELNSLYLGPQFEMAYEYATMACTFFSVLTYSAMIPLMPLLGAANFLLTYWVDKYFFVRLYRAPPRYSTDMNHYVTGLLPYAVLVNLVMAMWAFGNEDIFSSLDDQDDAAVDDTMSSTTLSLGGRVTVEQNIGAFILFVCLSVFLFVVYFIRNVGGALGTFLVSLFGDIYANIMINYLQLDERKGLHLEYHTAVACGRFKNLASYSMLQNPLYMTALRVSKEFADTHRYVDSLSHDRERKGTRTSMTGVQMTALRKQAIENAREEGILEGMESDDDERDERDENNFLKSSEKDDTDRMAQYVWKDIIAHEDDQI